VAFAVPQLFLGLMFKPPGLWRKAPAGSRHRLFPQQMDGPLAGAGDHNGMALAGRRPPAHGVPHTNRRTNDENRSVRRRRLSCRCGRIPADRKVPFVQGIRSRLTTAAVLGGSATDPLALREFSPPRQNGLPCRAPRCRTGAAGCAAGRRRARRRVTGTPSSMVSSAEIVAAPAQGYRVAEGGEEADNCHAHDEQWYLQSSGRRSREGVLKVFYLIRPKTPT
jgi:hypothetical protein